MRVPDPEEATGRFMQNYEHENQDFQVNTIDGFLRGIKVPAADGGIVELQYDSQAFRYGSFISIVACFCWLGGLLVVLRQKFSHQRLNLI